MSLGPNPLPSDPSFIPKVSVIVPIYNGENDVADLLDCLHRQTYPITQAEYLLVDNGSHDRTLSMLQTIANSTALPLRILSETAIQSSYAARNTGICAATGEILACTDADCRPAPDWLFHLVQPFVQPSIGLVAGEIVALPGNSLLEHYADRHETLSQKHTLAHSFCPYGQTANLGIRRLVLQQTGLFRPHLTTGGDADLCWRILQSKKWRIQFAEQSVVRHRHRSTLAELYSQWRRYGCSNRYLHELYGVSLMQDMTLPDYVYRGTRWLLKEVPAILLDKAHRPGDSAFSIDRLVDTPIDLFCRRARAQGQRQSQLPNAARQIAWLPSSSPIPDSQQSH